MLYCARLFIPICTVQYIVFSFHCPNLSTLQTNYLEYYLTNNRFPPKGTVARDFRPLVFFHESNPYEPLIHTIKHFRIRVRILDIIPI